MWRYVLVIIVVVVIGSGFMLVQDRTASGSPDLWSIQTDLKHGAVLLDVRSPQEFEREHASGAINIPLEQLKDQQFGPLQKQQKLYVYSQAGVRASEAVGILRAAGYSNVVDLSTIGAWISLGGVTERSVEPD